jgi:hypothetical protein
MGSKDLDQEQRGFGLSDMAQAAAKAARSTSARDTPSAGCHVTDAAVPAGDIIE